MKRMASLPLLVLPGGLPVFEEDVRLVIETVAFGAICLVALFAVLLLGPGQ